ncbi:hypothetical protein EST38_g3002 [Candolleomyces aberdarensis]|uniref:Dihydrodipicolinate synthetase n=1 Tax=Candolleomyces aberdarensis TaxID=2316362 RepID=A0A4Q2DUM0_9AGAR|nr:hypothetical protein EST38_g3002 [Candolleomyces aberdarensis]
MPATPPPRGVYVPAVLFFDENEDFDVPAIKAHVLHLAKGGVTGILVQGSNGEAQHLSREERKAAIALTRQTLDENGFKNTLVIAGTGAQSTRETKLFNEDAKEAGATFALVLTPSTWAKNMTTDAIIRFHREVADVSPIPTMIYNFPGVTAGLDLDSDIIFTLSAHPNIVGTKLSCGNIGKIQRLTSRLRSSEFAVFSGRSDSFVHGLHAGSAGGITALVNLIPRQHVEIFRSWDEIGVLEAMWVQAKLGHADWAISKIGGIGGIKALIVKHFGYGQPYVRGPLSAVNPDSLDKHQHYGILAELIGREKMYKEDE